MFYDILQKLCVEKGIKITQLLTKLDLSTGAISRWRSGTLPNAETLIKIADYFGVSTDYLLGRTKSRRISESQEVRLLDALTNLAIRMTNYDNATPSQLSLLLEVSKVLLEHYRAQ